MLKAILIDDEVHCQDTLSILLKEYCPEVRLLKKCNSAREGLEYIQEDMPDLVFLDIEMPLMNGFEFLEQFSQVPFAVIFTTSYDQYAIKAIRFSAMDYLLKPIEAKELIAAVHKVAQHKTAPSNDQLHQLMEHIRHRDDEITKIAERLDKSMPTVSSIGPLTHQRRLAAILFTDIVGYTAMMQKDEMHAVRIIKRYIEVLNEHVAAHNGEVLNDYGDGTLCAFSSSVEAVQCAYDIQKNLQKQPSVPLRIGLHIGEIFFENGKVMGDGVNLASRIQSMGRENMILFSEEIHDKIKNVSRFDSRCVGSFEFKNVDKPINVYALANEGLNVPRAESLEGKLKKPAGRGSWTDWLFGLNRK